RRRAEERQAFLLEAGELLAGSLDLDATLASAARLAVPRVAEWCNVYAVEEGVEVRRVAAAHAEPAKAALMQEIARRFPLSADPRHPVRRTLASREAVVSPAQAAAPAPRDAPHPPPP